MDNVTQMRLDQIAVRPELQPRLLGIDASHVRALEEAGGGWPAVVVVQWEGQYVLVDGFHRLCAAQNLGLEAIEARLVDLSPRQPIWALAFELNAAHGRPLSL